ncbi:hypothetical protein [Demequina aurantiaca]|uniref:hypothetical protein n=1 Tax=Demequina aurantiaca TaxID=676200 RepID=UPI003D3496B8
MSIRTRTRALSMASLVGALCAFALAGCAQEETSGAHINEPYEINATAPGEVVTTIAGVEYYPACGNEPLLLDGAGWYPFVPDSDAFPLGSDAPSGGADDAAAGSPPSNDLRLVSVGGRGYSRGGSVPHVVEPGPGDDLGTVTVYDNGVAYFRSDSGDLETWLTDERIIYNWAC